MTESRPPLSMKRVVASTSEAVNGLNAPEITSTSDVRKQLVSDRLVGCRDLKTLIPQHAREAGQIERAGFPGEEMLSMRFIEESD